MSWDMVQHHHVSVEGDEPPLWTEDLMLKLLSAATVARGSTSRQEILSIHVQFGNIYPPKMNCFVPKTSPNLP